MSGLGHWWQERPTDPYERSDAVEEREQAHRDGRYAWHINLHVSDNPYSPRSRKGRAWEEGWLEAESEA